MGGLCPDKVCATKRGTLEVPSDFAGIVWGGGATGSSGSKKKALARELEAAGPNINETRSCGIDIRFNKIRSRCDDCSM